MQRVRGRYLFVYSPSTALYLVVHFYFAKHSSERHHAEKILPSPDVDVIRFDYVHSRKDSILLLANITWCTLAGAKGQSAFAFYIRPQCGLHWHPTTGRRPPTCILTARSPHIAGTHSAVMKTSYEQDGITRQKLDQDPNAGLDLVSTNARTHTSLWSPHKVPLDSDKASPLDDWISWGSLVTLSIRS